MFIFSDRFTSEANSKHIGVGNVNKVKILNINDFMLPERKIFCKFKRSESNYSTFWNLKEIV